MSSAIIQPLTLDDLTDVSDIEKQVSQYPWSTQSYIDCLKANYQVWVLKNKKILGAIVTLSQLKECQVLNVFVAPDCQRQGYGRQLLKHAIDQAKLNGLDRVTLEVRISNQVAISVYHALGFMDVGIRKGFYPNMSGAREDALLMTLMLH